MKLEFDEKQHKYWVEENGQKRYLTSVTTLLGSLYPFDSKSVIEGLVGGKKGYWYNWAKGKFDEIVANEGEKYRFLGDEKVFSEGEVLADLIQMEWHRIMLHGTALHKAIECCVRKGAGIAIDENPAHSAAIRWFSAGKFSGKMKCETPVFNLKKGLAGTIDLIEEKDDFFVIYDIKTSRTIESDKLHKYFMQLDLYRLLLMQSTKSKKEVKIGGIIWYRDYMNRGQERPEFIKYDGSTRKDVVGLWDSLGVEQLSLL